MSAHGKLIGTWRLVAATSEDIATGQKTSIQGRKGFLNYGSDGRVFAILVDSDRRKPAGDLATATEAEDLFRFYGCLQRHLFGRARLPGPPKQRLTG